MTTTEVARTESKALTPVQQTKKMLDLRKEEFGKALAGRVDPEAFIRVAYATITKSPKLLEATPESVFFALLEAATLGLVPNGALGEAYIVPFNNKVKRNGREEWEVQAQFIPGYRGLIKLVRQSGVIRNVVARPVFKGDRFEVEYGLEETLVHIPNLDSEQDPDELTHVYAVAHFNDGAKQFEVMTRRGVDAIRARSKAKDSGPWVSDYVPMAIKTVIRRLVKYLPISDFDLTRAIEKDDEVLGADDITHLVAQTVAATQTRTEQVRDKVAARAITPRSSASSQPEDNGTTTSGGETTGGSGETTDSSGEVESSDRRTQETAPKSTLTGSDGPELDEFENSIFGSVIDGGDANQRQRNELCKLADQIYGEGTEEALAVRTVAETAALGKEQVIQFIGAARSVLKARDAKPKGEAKADPFGEEG